MALTVNDILELPSGQKMRLLAGKKGLNRTVASVGIADYEFVPDLITDSEDSAGLKIVMDPDSVIITSFLFAKDNPSVILPMVKTLWEMDVAAVAFKQIFYKELPMEVLAFAEENDFPILAFDREIWFENIIFDIMYAVQFDDRVYLSEEKIDAMVSGHMDPSELSIILKGISLRLRSYVSVTYIPGDSLDAGQVLRSFYLLKGFHDKGLLIRCRDDLFLLVTSNRDDDKSHDLIRREAFELLGIAETITIGTSDVQERKALDKAFRESRLCHLASRIEGRRMERFGKTGVYRVLLPALEHDETEGFANSIVGCLEDHVDLLETAAEYISAGGDVSKAAEALHCHQNTIRYRLSKMRGLIGLQDITDAEMYMQLKTALIIHRGSHGRGDLFGTRQVIAEETF